MHIIFLLLINITTALGTVKEHSKTPATVDPWMKSSAEINTAVWWSRDKTLGTLPLTGHSLKLLPMNQTCICLFNSSVGKWNSKKQVSTGHSFVLRREDSLLSQFTARQHQVRNQFLCRLELSQTLPGVTDRPIHSSSARQEGKHTLKRN